MQPYLKVNWHDEQLDGDNNGLIWGIYWLDGESVVEAEWFATERERDEAVA